MCDELDKVFREKNYKRREFVPLDSDKRFEFTTGRWEPTPPPTGKNITAESVRDYAHNCPAPRSFVDVPARMDCGGDVEPAKWITRDEAFAIVAELNRKEWEAQEGDKDMAFRDWQFVVELGQAPPCGNQVMCISEKGVGHYEVSSCRHDYVFQSAWTIAKQK